jgi:2-keto-4-pentenoate hydratase
VTPPDASDAVTRGMRALLTRRDADLATGARAVGWKIGFNTPAIQEAFGLAQPVVGYLTDAGLTPDGATVPLAGWAAPAVEVEMSIRVGLDPDGRGLGVAGLAPALELVDLGVPFHDIEVVLAGNICQRGVVFGAEVPGVDPWAVVATVTTADDTRVAEGRLTEDPATTVAFVRSFLAAHGAQLRDGDRIIAGSLVAPVAVAPGDALDVTFGPLGALRLAFG